MFLVGQVCVFLGEQLRLAEAEVEVVEEAEDVMYRLSAM